jgi:hypothetical protein
VAFGEKVLESLSMFIQGVYAARSDPDIALPEKLLARKSGGLGSDKRQDLSLLPVKVPTVIEHKCFKSGQRVAGF